MLGDCRGGPATDGEEPRQAAEASCSGAGEEGTLVGTVEVSVAASTRTRFLTLNAPEVTHFRRAILCSPCLPPVMYECLFRSANAIRYHSQLLPVLLPGLYS